MSISTTPLPPPPKKKGMGCLGCGCALLVLLVILGVGLVAGISYLLYNKVLSLTTTMPAAIPSFNGSDDLFNTAQQKIDAFQHDLDNHQAAMIDLSADEINTVLARNPGLGPRNAHLFVTLTNDQARVQGSLPTDVLSRGFINGRYLNFDSTFSVNFNPDDKNVDLLLHHLQIGDTVVPDNALPTMQSELTIWINAELHQSAGSKNLLRQAKSIQVKDGELEIETQ